jgi:hypothetical protein
VFQEKCVGWDERTALLGLKSVSRRDCERAKRTTRCPEKERSFT